MFPQLDSIFMPVPVERRSLPRLWASRQPARIAWKGEGLRMSKGPALLIDITANGASLIAERPGKPGEALWLGLPSLPCEWVNATIRGNFPEGSRWRLHLAFCEPCPVGLLEEAIGLSAWSEKMPDFRSFRGDDDDDEKIHQT